MSLGVNWETEAQLCSNSDDVCKWGAMTWAGWLLLRQAPGLASGRWAGVSGYWQAGRDSSIISLFWIMAKWLSYIVCVKCYGMIKKEIARPYVSSWGNHVNGTQRVEFPEREGGQSVQGPVIFLAVWCLMWLLGMTGRVWETERRREDSRQENSVCISEAWVRTGLRLSVWGEYGQALGTRRTKGSEI